MICNNCGREIPEGKMICRICATQIKKEGYLYDLKPSLMTKSERNYYKCIVEVLPKEYRIQPQVNLATFINRNDNSKYHNELFRNVDFLITDQNFKPVLVIEINDSTHLEYDRKKRDKKVAQICSEAGIGILTLWTSYGVNKEYISKKITEKINEPVVRKHNFEIDNNSKDEYVYNSKEKTKDKYIYNSNKFNLKIKNIKYSKVLQIIRKNYCLKWIVIVLLASIIPYIFIFIIGIIIDILKLFV